MSGFAASQAHDDVDALKAQVKTLTVEKLKILLRSESLPLSGIKSELQMRTITHIEKLRNAGDISGLNRIRGSIRGHPYQFPSSPYSRHTPTSSASPSFSSPTAHNSYNMSSNSTFGSSRITYKPSPFYTIIRSLTQTYECKARESTRDTARLTLNLSQDIIDKLNSDASCRIMVFCASEAIGPYSRDGSDIAFPHNVELKCNGDEVKANLRGLKNRPGSTRPADITTMIRTRPAGYPNSVEMVYALTTKIIYAEQAGSKIQKFYLVVNLVSKKSIDAMVSQLRHGRMISKDQVIREMRRKADDPDEIMATSTVLSLKDPVGYTRITTPCRGLACSHVQCFDAGYYLQLQEQAPTWTCPICNKAAPWEQLALDQYVNDILNLTPKSVEAVTVEPYGTWRIQTQAENNGGRTSNPTPSDDGDDDDDDVVEISNGPGLRAAKLETLLTPHSVRTPPLSSREESTAPSVSRPSANPNKRPRDVIDLTLSDDDEDGRPAPKASRMSASSDAIISSARQRPPSSDRYNFQLPPLFEGRPPSYNFDRFNPTL
ncbi:E3 SUMO-protein ligase pli1 [Cladophialophora chaetospira]|uniref:E3 SUMO-protein ligase pli1 n=1 Tax=Cladophialophora chaetospira TaxID=386627 RepID=A0AA39CL60_9EURO|nr:E3 SUMO-protein ligase pli1 [Cladophialophora chaetospira]